MNEGTASVWQQMIKHYVIEPGDATRYHFWIGHCDTATVHQTIKWEQNGELDGTYNIAPYYPFSGVGDGSRFAVIGIDMLSNTGFAIIDKQNLISGVDEGLIDYFIEHSNSQLDRYTVCAVLLACQVLVQDPLFLSKAAKAMLNMSEILTPKAE